MTYHYATETLGECLQLMRKAVDKDPNNVCTVRAQVVITGRLYRGYMHTVDTVGNKLDINYSRIVRRGWLEDRSVISMRGPVWKVVRIYELLGEVAG